MQMMQSPVTQRDMQVHTFPNTNKYYVCVAMPLLVTAVTHRWEGDLGCCQCLRGMYAWL